MEFIKAKPSKKQRVVIEYFHSFKFINPDSLFTKTRESAMNIVEGRVNVLRAWFRGEMIFENKEMIEKYS